MSHPKPQPDNPLYCDTHALTRMAQQGDRQVLARLEACHGDCLRAVGRARCASCADAEDAVQDAFANAARHLDSFKATGTLHGWMNTLVANACHRMRRGARNTPARHIPLLPQHLTQPNPEHTLTKRLHAQQALQLLPPHQRDLFWLATIEGWTAPELAQRLHTTPTAIRARLKRIRQHLRNHLPKP